jgi:hypothetical protein
VLHPKRFTGAAQLSEVDERWFSSPGEWTYSLPKQGRELMIRAIQSRNPIALPVSCANLDFEKRKRVNSEVFVARNCHDSWQTTGKRRAVGNLFAWQVQFRCLIHRNRKAPNSPNHMTAHHHFGRLRVGRPVRFATTWNPRIPNSRAAKPDFCPETLRSVLSSTLVRIDLTA